MKPQKERIDHVRKRDEVNETCENIERYYKVEKGLIPQVKEDVVKVGRLNITDHEKAPKESQRLEERIITSPAEKPGKDQKVTQYRLKLYS